MAAVIDLDDRVNWAADYWGLTIGQALAGGTRSAVFAAQDLVGQALVLKLPATRTDTQDLTAAEAAALSSWSSTGVAVTLVDATPDALLLVRARPGILLPWSPDGTIDDGIAIAVDVLTRLWAQPAVAYRFPTLAEVYNQDERVAREDAAFEQRERGEPDRGMPGLLRLPVASAAAEHLISTCREQRVLHGDFITKNLVSDVTSPAGWVALDPLPMTGDPAAEVAAFAAYHPADLILPVAEALARSLSVDIQRALHWAAIWTVHQTAQAWRDDQAQLERIVESAAMNDLLAI